MTFKFELLPHEKIENTDTDSGRYYTKSNSQDKLWSVTTVLSRTEHNSLQGWRARIGDSAAKAITRQAGYRGSIVHRCIEQYLKGEDYKSNLMPNNLYTFNQFKEQLDENLSVVYGIEFPIFDLPKPPNEERAVSSILHSLRCAGRIDLLGIWGGVESIIDFKTSRTRKKREWIENYFLQTETYGDVVNRSQNQVEFKQTVIIITDDKSPKPQIFVTPLGEHIDRVRKIFNDSSFNQPVDI